MSTEKTVLVLRTCNADMTSYNGFVWPKDGHVSCPDWSPVPECGQGLHGFLWGEGDGNLIGWNTENLVWQVVRVKESDIVNLDGKVKFPEGEVIFTGDQKGATDFLIANGAQGKTVIGAFVSGGDNSTVSGGHRSTVSGGHRSTVSGGYRSTVSGGYRSTVSGGYRSTVSGGCRSTVSGGCRSTVSGGDSSTVSGGDYSTVSGGCRSTVSGGDYSTVSGGHESTVSGGDYSTVSGGDYSTVSGGDNSVLQVKWYDGKRDRVAIGYVGEDGIEANVFYKVDNQGKFFKV